MEIIKNHKDRNGNNSSANNDRTALSSKRPPATKY